MNLSKRGVQMAAKTKIKSTTLLRRSQTIVDVMCEELKDIVTLAKDRGRSPRVAEIMIRKKLFKMTNDFEDVLEKDVPV